MTQRRVGLWLIGAYGGVAGTVALGIAALKRGLSDTTALVTALSDFAPLDLDGFDAFVIGGHDIRAGSLYATVSELHERSNVFTAATIASCQADLDAWSANVRPGTVLNAGATIASLADLPAAQQVSTPRQAIARIQADLREFRDRNQLDQVVVLNVSSTEPPFDLGEEHESLDALNAALDRIPGVLPASSIYAYAALDLGFPYANFTPSLGTSIPALEELALARKTVHAGKDGKTGETLMKSVLAPMFAHRNLKILSWVGHNIFGNRDGQVLNDPVNKSSKIRTKDALISQIVGYKPQTLVTIEYIPSLDDWKTAWNHIHFEGFLGTKMILQFIWQGCDSLLAAPLAIDIIRLTLFAQRRGEVGVLKHLAPFFKNPMGEKDHDFFVQFDRLRDYVHAITAN